MKKLFTLLATVTLSVMLFAQAPQSFSYQTVIRDASWQVLSNQTISLEISIIEDALNGTAIYTEFLQATTNELGLVNLSIGVVGGQVTSGSWSNIDWGNHTYFIEVAVDVTGGTSYIVMGTTQLRSVPYALYAETSGSMLPGPQGAQGVQGIQGLPGDTGAVGPQGLTGATGPAGANGIDGTNGVDGNDGAAGVDGTNGVDGNDGAPGVDGTNGIDGVDGIDGTNGVDGNDGAVGATGAQGIQGVTGNDGAVGSTGPIGLTGVTGIQGPQGNQGIQGPTGIQGPQGIQGVPGNDGIDGTDGVDGTFPNGADAGEMMYWDGTNWLAVTPPTASAAFKFINGAPTWVEDAQIGDFRDGGIVFWVDATGQQGLVCAVSDQSTGIQWFNGSFTTTGAIGTAIGTGASNTGLIISNQGSGSYAAQVCNDLSLNNYYDWYLPSNEELNKMFVNKAAIDATAIANGGSAFANYYYWSSTEFDSGGAWGQDFGSGGQYFNGKFDVYGVRAVRAF